MKRLLLIICMVLLSLNGVKADDLKPLPTIESMSQATFEEQTSLVTQSFEKDPSLSFQIRLPKSFAFKSEDQLRYLESEYGMLGEIAHAYGQAYQGQRPYFSVMAYEQERMISVKNWFVSEVLKNAYTLRGIETGDDSNSFEAFYVRLNKFNQTEIVRARGFLHESRFVLAEYVIPNSLWERDRDKQIYAMQSFAFKNPPRSTYVEDIREYEYLESFIMQYPSGFSLMGKQTYGETQHEVSLVSRNAKGFELAEINIMLVSSKSFNDADDQTIYSVDFAGLLNEKKATLAEQNYIADDVLETRQFDLSIPTQLQVTEIYSLRKKKPAVFVNGKVSPIVKEYWLSVIRSTPEIGKTYIVTMMAPARDNDFYNWAIAAKSYEEIVKSLR